MVELKNKYNSVLCQFINNNPDWKEKLQGAPYFVKIKEYGELFIFNYDPVCAFLAGSELDFRIPEVQESRGIILKVTGEDVEPVCRPFRKFCNYGEKGYDKINWDTAEVLEKVDGSITKLFYYKGEWCLATNSCIDAENAKAQGGKSYGELFFDAALEQNLNYDILDKGKTYIFELVSPETQVVIFYPKTEIYFLEARDNKTGEESIPDIGIKKPQRYKIKTLEDCQKAVQALNSPEVTSRDMKEGFVVIDGTRNRDGSFNRVKIKSPEYLEWHRAVARGPITTKKILEMIKSDDVNEFLVVFPEYSRRVEKVKEACRKIKENVSDTIKIYLDIYHGCETQKQFAVRVKNDPLKDIAFYVSKCEIRGEQATVEGYLKTHLEKNGRLEEEVEREIGERA